MKALALTETGGIEHLRVQELPEPTIREPGEVLVRIQTMALNRLDLFVVGGLPGASHGFPHVVGSDGAGIVQQVGPGVTHLRPGDRVMINPTIACGRCPSCEAGEHSLCSRLRVLGEHCSGTAAEYVVLPGENLAAVPPSMPWAEAAAFSLATLTAWRMLVSRAQVQPGETVLIWGIGGGVALAALQVALLVGARAIVTSGADAKLEVARKLGAENLLNYRQSDVASEVRKLTGGRGADVVIDSVGEQSWQASLRSLRRGGRLVVCGATSGPHVSLDLRRLFWHQWDLLGSTLGSQREYAEVVRLAGEGKLWPVIDSVVPLREAVTAYERLQRGEHVGKLVIEVAQ
ncbi:MAG TPA: zinc-binding dehydrogenase [Gemmatimonadales bacterium]|jgi:NADPH:quinone reductase-like Zn-dependent oxidoreductase